MCLVSVDDHIIYQKYINKFIRALGHVLKDLTYFVNLFHSVVSVLSMIKLQNSSHFTLYSS